MDAYRYFWGTVKFIVPLILFIISMIPPENFILTSISILWFFSALIVTVMVMPESGKKERRT